MQPQKHIRKRLALALLCSTALLTTENASGQTDTAYRPKIGKFVSVKPTSQTQTLVLPSTHTFQLLAKAGVTAYTNAAGTTPAGNDFTPYLGKNGSSKEGYVGINHENNPGGFSILDVKLNEATMTWGLDGVRKVDFAPVVTTERNCSGGITPWGTFITSEEAFTIADANLDGYQDRGWQVEINPVTGQIADYNNDGTPDKLWAHGRMSHENIAISTDSITTYQTEDGGTGCVYKFVASQKGNLSAGTLYVLKRDALPSTTGIWVQVPNTTQSDRNNTRTLAGSLGGTNWNGPEDIEFGPDGKMYFTAKGTGTIWRFKDDGLTVSQIEAWVTNQPYLITYADSAQNENWGTGIDNLVFDADGNLWAQQDGGRNHLWVIRPDHTPASPKVELFATIPAGAESTGLHFSPDNRYGFMSIQHPNGTNTLIRQDATGADVRFNAASTIVFARKEFLGPLAVEPRFDLGADQLICNGDSLTLSAYSDTDAIVKWSGSALIDSVAGSDLVVKNPGMYYATAFKNNGRRYTDSIQVTVETVSVDLGYNLPLCNTCSLTLDAGAGFDTYLWSDNSTARTMVVNHPGSYSVVATSVNNCTAKDTVQVVQQNGNGNILVPAQMIDIYPNPFQVSTTIKLSVPAQANIVLEVYTNAGNLVSSLHNGTLGIGDHYFNFQPSGQANNGVYIVKLWVNNQQVSKMIRKQ